MCNLALTIAITLSQFKPDIHNLLSMYSLSVIQFSVITVLIRLWLCGTSSKTTGKSHDIFLRVRDYFIQIPLRWRSVIPLRQLSTPLGIEKKRGSCARITGTAEGGFYTLRHGMVEHGRICSLFCLIRLTMPEVCAFQPDQDAAPALINRSSWLAMREE